MDDEEEFDVEAEIAARDHAIVELTLACFHMQQHIRELTLELKEARGEKPKHVDVYVH